MFLERGTLGFCEHVLETLTKDLNASFSLPKPTPKPTSKPVENTTLDADPEPLPTETELHAHYTSVFKAVEACYGPSFVCPPDVLKAYFDKNKELFPTRHVYDLLAMVSHVEMDPPLFPLLDRLERLLRESLVAFLPMEELIAFFTGEWDGSESGLRTWEHHHYHIPLQKPTKKMLAHWAVAERCPVLATLTSTDLDEFLRIASHPMYATRKMNAPQILAGMDLTRRRRMIFLDATKTSTALENFFAFWDLSWLPEKVSHRTIVPMDGRTLTLSEKKFATQYFSSTYSDNEIMLWAGKIPFRIEYVRADGTRMVQTREMFEAHRRHREDKGWGVLVAHLPEHVYETLKTMMVWWITSALHNILSGHDYDVALLTRRITRPMFKKPTSLGTMLDRAYEVVGRLHPFFPLSRQHGVLVERIRHLYFVPEMLTSLPRVLLFPEYFIGKDHHRAVMDAQWETDRQRFYSSVLAQFAEESTGAVAGASSFPALQGMPHPRRLSRNVHVEENGTTTTLSHVMERWEEMFLDEDIVPQGLETIGLLVEAPDYYRNDGVREDVRTFLDRFATVPSFHPYPLYSPTEKPEEEEEEKEEEEKEEEDEE